MRRALRAIGRRLVAPPVLDAAYLVALVVHAAMTLLVSADAYTLGPEAKAIADLIAGLYTNFSALGPNPSAAPYFAAAPLLHSGCTPWFRFIATAAAVCIHSRSSRAAATAPGARAGRWSEHLAGDLSLGGHGDR